MRLMFAALVLGACATPHKMPSEDEPHARVILKSRHHAEPGPEKRFETAINGREVRAKLRRDRDGFEVRETRIKPGKTKIRFSSQFGNTTVTTEWRTAYRTESYQCGTMRMPQTCTRQVPYQRLETIPVFLPMATCAETVNTDALDGDTIVVEYEFFADGDCEIRSFVAEDEVTGS